MVRPFVGSDRPVTWGFAPQWKYPLNTDANPNDGGEDEHVAIDNLVYDWI
jgi:hypothetical protein